MLLPSTEQELAEIVRAAAAEGAPLALIGHGTTTGWGRPVSGRVVSLRQFRGVHDYAPEELVLTAGAGTPLAEIEQALGARNQHLAFEPVDLGPVFGAPAGQATIGGVIACNLSGPRRPFAGAARDFFLGFKGVNGAGEAVKAGAKVVKNVTGYDLPKLVAGSFGTLVAMTEVTLKVVPQPETSAALVVENVEIARANRLMTAALASTAEPTGAAYLPSRQQLFFRLEGSGPSVAYRLDRLKDLVGEGRVLGADAARTIWQGLRNISHLIDPVPPILWSLSVPPAGFSGRFERLLGDLPGADALVDWGGGRIWLSHFLTGFGEATQAVHRYLGGQGHATLLRAPDDWRSGAEVFMPDVPAALLRRIRLAFDPQMIFNRGRLHPDL